MNHRFLVIKLVLLFNGFILFFNVGCATKQLTLRDAYKDKFVIGTAVKDYQWMQKNPLENAVVKTQFSSISPENLMKWEEIHPEPDLYDFDAADQYVDFGVKNKMFIIGHTLLWHSQTPRWVFQNDEGKTVDRATLLKRLQDHIQTVVGRYKGRVKGWDVVNEVLWEDGSLRSSQWKKILGDDYIIKAFEFAHAADPNAELYYNDYGIEEGKKLKGALALVKKLKDANVPITGVGIQEHVDLTWP
ncbi:TPA: 1,4-beta-xylanase, partial [Candidatus Sumerlaeota bacterium]|nr:1,4-beta-xylanase [Candidatus Sumerlaeota bacterium]